jgi:hypothetical protein
MPSSRRGFLKSSAFTVLATTMPISIRSLAFAKTPQAPGSPRVPNYADFAASMNHWFMIEGEDSPASDWIRLVRIRDLRSDAIKIDRRLEGKDCFALIFSGASGHGSLHRTSTQLAEGMYRLRHDRLGEFSLLISPAGIDADGPLYSAVINHVIP